MTTFGNSRSIFSIPIENSMLSLALSILDKALAKQLIPKVKTSWRFSEFPNHPLSLHWTRALLKCCVKHQVHHFMFKDIGMVHFFYSNTILSYFLLTYFSTTLVFSADQFVLSFLFMKMSGLVCFLSLFIFLHVLDFSTTTLFVIFALFLGHSLCLTTLKPKKSQTLI